MKRELRDVIDEIIPVLEDEDMGLPEMRDEVEKIIVRAFDVIDSIEDKVKESITDIDESSGDRIFILERIAEKLY